MMHSMWSMIILFSTLTLASSYAGDRFEVAGTTEAAVLEFDAMLKRIAKQGSLSDLRLVMDFPFTVNDNSKTISYKDWEALEPRLTSVFDTSLLKVIECQRPKDLFASWRGLSYGNGALWVQAIANASASSASRSMLRIVAINVAAVLDAEKNCFLGVQGQ